MQAEADAGLTNASHRVGTRRLPWGRAPGSGGLIAVALFFLVSLAAYLTDVAIHSSAVTWYDLNVYNDAGLITRQLPSILYAWQLTAGVKFTYTPFAAILFAGGTFLPWTALRWTMTVVSLISIPLTAWLTIGAMGRRGASRASLALVVGAVALWIEPVVKSVDLGQIEPLLMLLVVWDLTRSDQRRWKGVGVGLAAGIKLIPLIFIPFLLLSGKVRQAAVATAAFAATVALGFIALPGQSASYWLTGYFWRPGRTGAVDALVNQSLLGVISRQAHTSVQAQAVWLPVAVAVALLGVIGGAMLSRAGKPVQGWVLVGLTSVLVSPISWDHHWVWFVPFLAMLAGLASASRGPARSRYWTVMLATAAVVAAWPRHWSGPAALLPGRGFLGWFVHPPQVYQVRHLHGWQLLTWNLYAAVGSAAYLAMLAGAWVAWRKRSRPRGAGPSGPGEVDGLLARADAVLRRDDRSGQADGGNSLIGSNHEV